MSLDNNELVGRDMKHFGRHSMEIYVTNLEDLWPYVAL